MKHLTIKVRPEKLLLQITKYCTGSKGALVLIEQELYDEYIKTKAPQGIFTVRSYCKGWLQVTQYHYGRDWRGYVAEEQSFEIEVRLVLK